MGELHSARFTQGDGATIQKLEDCARGRPNEVLSHFTLGQSGPAVTKLQEALREVQQNNPSLGIPTFTVNGQYDGDFARAILIYKTKREIRNFSGRFDDIVGIKTIRILDAEKRPRTNPGPAPLPKRPGEFPRPDRPSNPSSCVTDTACPLQTNFVIQLIAGATVGEILEGGVLTFIIKDKLNRLSCLYSLTSGGFATPGLPFTPSVVGSPTPFITKIPTKITRFGPIGGITGVTLAVPGSSPIPGLPSNLKKTIISTLTFSFRISESAIPSGFVVLNNFDTGPISVEGAGIQGGRFKLENRCAGELGADRTI